MPCCARACRSLSIPDGRPWRHASERARGTFAPPRQVISSRAGQAPRSCPAIPHRGSVPQSGPKIRPASQAGSSGPTIMRFGTPTVGPRSRAQDRDRRSDRKSRPGTSAGVPQTIAQNAKSPGNPGLSHILLGWRRGSDPDLGKGQHPAKAGKRPDQLAAKAMP